MDGEMRQKPQIKIKIKTFGSTRIRLKYHFFKLFTKILAALKEYNCINALQATLQKRSLPKQVHLKKLLLCGKIEVQYKTGPAEKQVHIQTKNQRLTH
jgi:hypothetical protein